MKISFLFNGKSKIILTCESKRDEMMMQLARDSGPGVLSYRGDNSLEITFETTQAHTQSQSQSHTQSEKGESLCPPIKEMTKQLTLQEYP